MKYVDRQGRLWLFCLQMGCEPVRNDALELTLLFDCYSGLLTEKQRSFFDMYYNNDLSLSEIAEEAGISRQGVYDAIVRAEQSLRSVEEKTGCAARELRYARVLDEISLAARQLSQFPNDTVSRLAAQILTAAASAKE